MLNEYCNKLLHVYLGDGKNYIFFSLNSGFFSVWDLDYYGLFLGTFKNFTGLFLGDHHQQEKVVDSEIYYSTKDRQQQSPGSKLDLKIYDSTKDHEQQSPGSMVI